MIYRAQVHNESLKDAVLVLSVDIPGTWVQYDSYYSGTMASGPENIRLTVPKSSIKVVKRKTTKYALNILFEAPDDFLSPQSLKALSANS
jgi:hypothetical protein